MADQMTLTAPVTGTDATFVQEVIESDLPVMVDFWAPWCGPCRMVAPSLDKIAQEYAGKFKVVKINVDENPWLSQQFQVMSIPTLMIFKNRYMIFNQAGALPEHALRELTDKALEWQPEETDAQAAEHDHAGHNHEGHNHA